MSHNRPVNKVPFAGRRFWGRLFGDAAGRQRMRMPLHSRPRLEALESRALLSACSAPSDFNRDGFADLAVGAPYEDIGDVTDAGAVHVMYGSPVGLTAVGNQRWDESMLGGELSEGDRFGSSLAVGDFNGDGFSDLAIGIPYKRVDGQGQAGAVRVLYGSAGGLSDGLDDPAIPDTQLWHQNSSETVDGDTYAIVGTAELRDHFGWSLAAGDFDGDGFSDLAVGVPFEDIGADEDDQGVVNVLYGTAGGLSAIGNQMWHQDSEDIEGGAEDGDRFGSALAAGDFDGDGFSDLAIGVPLEDVGDIEDAGAVNVLYGTPDGLTAARNRIVHQDSEDIEGTAEEGDQFGHTLAVGDFDANGCCDLAVGVPYEDIGDIAWAGAVNVIYGLPVLGLAAAGNQIWHQDSAGVGGTAELDDRFGFALAAGDFDGDGFSDLAIGVPFEDIGADEDDQGVVNVLYGMAGGLSAIGDQLWHQGSSITLAGTTYEMEGSPEDADRFGYALAAGDFNGDGMDDLAIGIPFEDIGTIADAGAIQVMYGLPGLGLTPVGNRVWHQDSEEVVDDILYEIVGGAEEGDRFGFRVAAK